MTLNSVSYPSFCPYSHFFTGSPCPCPASLTCHCFYPSRLLFLDQLLPHVENLVCPFATRFLHFSSRQQHFFIDSNSLTFPSSPLFLPSTQLPRCRQRSSNLLVIVSGDESLNNAVASCFSVRLCRHTRLFHCSSRSRIAGLGIDELLSCCRPPRGGQAGLCS